MKDEIPKTEGAISDATAGVPSQRESSGDAPAFDFERDWRDHVIGELTHLGYAADPTESLDKQTFKLYNARLRRIPTIPRRVYEARGLSCPTEQAAGYDALKAKLAAGDDVNVYLSKTLLDADYDDALLNDWGIHHLHLGTKVARGFVDRTGPLLFARFTGDAVYCIAIHARHGGWTEKSLVATIHRNWPNVIAPYRIPGAIGVDIDHTSADRALLRQAGIQTFVEVEPGAVYGPIGGGYSSAGTSVAAQIWTNRRLRLLRALGEWVGTNVDELLKEVAETGRKPASPPTFALLVKGDELAVLETGSRVAWPTPN
ncbi:MAG TPA: hypothetical protein VEV38_06070 [Candidatus Eremiobacteraceae bacterium]|nr:hypothetical protein [Candidatus Eremiobacteraceae bacterium]